MAACVSCDPDRVFDQAKRIGDQGWAGEKPFIFNVKIDDTAASYNMSLLIRNTTSYAYSNLYLFLTTTAPGGQHARDTLECLLAAPDGKWLGKGMGKVRDNRFLIKKGVRFSKAGIWTFTLEQAMREESLNGITDAGIRIELEKKNTSR